VEEPAPGAGWHRRARPNPRPLRLSTRDLELLEFVGQQRLVLATHVQALLGVSARAAAKRLLALSSLGYLTGDWFHEHYWQATTKGLGVVGLPYSRSKFDPQNFAHEVGMAWVSLAARRGLWGEMREVISERQMRSADGVSGTPQEPMGVRLGGFGPAGKRRLHYPDMLLLTPGGQRIAFELELTHKSRTRLETIIAGYASDRRIDAVVYLVENPAIARKVQRAAASYGVGHMVHVQGAKWAEGAKPGGATRALQRTSAVRDRSAAR
jgi:hypothetical protein